jgi:hypothetical protein
MVSQNTTSKLPPQALAIDDSAQECAPRNSVRGHAREATQTQAAPLPQGYLTRQEAARYLGVSLRWLEGNMSLPKVDIAQPGARRPTWRYRVADLDAWMEKRLTAQDTRRAQ